MACGPQDWADISGSPWERQGIFTLNAFFNAVCSILLTSSCASLVDFRQADTRATALINSGQLAFSARSPHSDRTMRAKAEANLDQAK